ncbi:hypothetical protein JCM15124A_16170 [Prevotella falsenii]
MYKDNNVDAKRFAYSGKRNDMPAQTKNQKKAEINDIYYLFKEYTYQYATTVL